MVVPLEPGALRLHVTRLETLDDARIDSYERIANPAEKKRSKAFHFEQHRREYLATRGLVRHVLGGYAEEDPRTLRFVEGAWGKPAIVHPHRARKISFNVSNTEGMVVLLVALERDVGVDVERLDRTSDLDAVAARVFSATELAALKALPKDDQRERFFAYWTLKEAYIKARGMGLALPLEKFAFELDKGQPIKIAFEPPIDDTPMHWQFGQTNLSPLHRAAWAIRRDGEDLPIEIVETIP